MPDIWDEATKDAQRSTAPSGSVSAPAPTADIWDQAAAAAVPAPATTPPAVLTAPRKRTMDVTPDALRIVPRDVEQFLGIRYQFGGEGNKGIDCSAFTQQLYARNGVKGLPRTADEQWRAPRGQQLSDLTQIQPGDQLFFQGKRLGAGKASHTAYFAGWDTQPDGTRVPMMYAASSGARAVVKQRLDTFLRTSGQDFLGARRYPEFQGKAPQPAAVPAQPRRVRKPAPTPGTDYTILGSRWLGQVGQAIVEGVDQAAQGIAQTGLPTPGVPLSVQAYQQAVTQGRAVPLSQQAAEAISPGVSERTGAGAEAIRLLSGLVEPSTLAAGPAAGMFPKAAMTVFGAQMAAEAVQKARKKDWGGAFVDTVAAAAPPLIHRQMNKMAARRWAVQKAAQILAEPTATPTVAAAPPAATLAPRDAPSMMSEADVNAALQRMREAGISVPERILPRKGGQPATPAPQRPSPAQSGAVEAPPAAPTPVETPAPPGTRYATLATLDAFEQAVQQAPAADGATRRLADVYKIMKAADPKLTKQQFAATVDYAHNSPDVPLEAEGPSGAIKPAGIFRLQGRRYAYIAPKEVPNAKQSIQTQQVEIPAAENVRPGGGGEVSAGRSGGQGPGNSEAAGRLQGAAQEGQEAPQAVEPLRAVTTPPVREGWVNPDEIGVKPGMQYKREGITDTATGTGQQLKGTDTYDVDQAGMLTIWRDREGRQWVVNGHHRLELAQRADRFVESGPGGEQRSVPRQVRVRVLDEANGWSMEDARAQGAMENIRDGKGSALDALTVLHDLKIAPEQFKAHGLSLSSEMARNLRGLMGLDDLALNRVKMGDAPESVGAGIGSIEGLSAEAQRGALDEAIRGGIASYDRARRLAEIYHQDEQSGVLSQANEGDLFGGEFGVSRSSRVERVRIEDEVRRKLQQERSQLLKPVGAELQQGEHINAEARKAEALKYGGTGAELKDRVGLVFRYNEGVRNEIARLASEVASGKRNVSQAADELLPTLRGTARQSVADIVAGRAVSGDRGPGDVPAVAARSAAEENLLSSADAAPPRVATPARPRSSSYASREAPGATTVEPAETNTAPALPQGAVRRAMEASQAPQSQPVPSPELVGLARRLMGEFPSVKRLPKARGLFRPRGAGEIAINPATAKDPVQLARTMAHEIGHLTDFQPDQTMGRGNILGRVGTLKRWLHTTIGELPTTPDDFLTPKERAKIRQQAMKAVGKPPADDVAAWRAEVSAEYRRMIEDEIGRRNLVTRQEVHDELMSLSEWWRPYEPGRDAGYDAYRASSPELYADALSVWLNAPAELQQRAPLFYRMLSHYLDRKPNVLEAYADVQQILNGTPEGLADARRADIRRGFLRGENVMRAVAAERQIEKQSFFDYVAQQLVDVGMPAIKREKALLRRRISIPEEQSVRYALEELNYRDNANHVFLRAVERDVSKPLAKANVDLMDAGEYLLMRRIMTERKEIPNPWGHTPSSATQMMADMEQRLGPERFGVLKQTMAKLDDLVYSVAEEAVQTGAYNKKTFDDVIAPNKGQYAAFAVVDHLSDNIPAGIRQQVGTFKEVANPFTATVMKTMSLIRLNELQRAKKAVIGQMMTHYPEEISRHVVPPKGHPPRLAPGNDHIVFMENGRPVYYETDKYTAAVFRHRDIEMLSRAARAIGFLNHRVFHPLYVTFNPSFQAANVLRDLTRTWINLGATYGVTLREVLSAYKRAVPAALRRARGLPDAKIDEMIAEKALDIPFSQFDISAESTAYDRMMARYGLTDLKEGAKPKLVELLSKLTSPIHVIGDTIEGVPKVAAYDLLTERGVTGKRRSYAVRNYVGTPNLRRRGMSTEITGNILMYSNVALQGLRADAEIAFAPRTRSGWMMRTALITAAPKLAQRAALAGLFGYAVQKQMEAVPEYDLTNYLIIPFGWASNGKVAYLRVPHGDTQRLLAGVMWKLSEGRLPEAAQFSYGQLPNLAPAISIPAKWAEYGRGQNPRDEFRGRDIITPDAYAAGGFYALNDMLHYTVGQFGVVSTLATAVTGKPGEQTPPTTTERVVGTIPGLERFIRFSDRGISEKEWDDVRDHDAAAALTRLKLPQEARQLSREQNRLMRLWTAGGIGATDRARLDLLNAWASRYKRAVTVLKAAEEAKDAKGAKQLREQIREDATAAQKELKGRAYQSTRPGREPGIPRAAGRRMKISSPPGVARTPTAISAAR